MENLLKKSKILLSNGDLKGSYEELSTIISNQRHGRSMIETVVKDSSERLSDCVLLSNEQLAEVYNSRGHVRYLLVDFNEAIEDYTEAILLNSRHGIAYYNRGQVHYRMGRYKEAEKDLLTSLDIIPDFEDAKQNLKQVRKDLAAGHKFNV